MPLSFSHHEPHEEPGYKDSVMPAHFQKEVLKDWKVNYVKGRNGEWLVQHREGHNFELCDYRFIFHEPDIIYPVIPKPMITLVFVIRGSFTCWLAGAGKISLLQGQSYLFYLPRGGGHEAWFEKISANIFHIVLETEYLERNSRSHAAIADLLEQLQKQSAQGKQVIGTRITLESLGKIEGMKSYRGQPEDTNMYMEAEIIHLLINYGKKTVDVDDYGKLSQWQMDEKLKLAKEFMDNNPGKRYDRKMVAAHIGLNVQYLGKFFKKKYGYTIKEYQQHIQFGRAIDLLINTDEQVIAIAIELGYIDEQGFIRLFRKKFDTTPLQYRLHFRRIRVE